jgi:ribosome assembly protein 3
MHANLFAEKNLLLWCQHTVNINRPVLRETTMSIVPNKEKNNKPKSNRRRNKKRRTEDFSDSSSSESSSDNESEVEERENEANDTIIEEELDAVLSDVETENAKTNDEDFLKTKGKLQTIHLTKTQLNEANVKNLNTAKIAGHLKKDTKDLENDYMGLMFENYGEDINNLRNASDFNERSLSILANALKNGGNIFDEETLKAVVGGNTN